MSEFVGRTGSNRVYSYPEAPRGRPGLLKVGYDQPLDTQSLALIGVVLPRDLALAPLQVQLGSVTPGNILEVDCTASFSNIDADPVDHTIVTVAVVHFGATPPPFGPGVGWNFIGLSLDAQKIPPLPAVSSLMQMRNFVGVPIPVGAVAATVQIAYIVDADHQIEIFGLDLQDAGPMTTLKASEISAMSVTQAGPAILVPV